MKSSLNLSTITDALSHFLHRFHVVIFTLFVIGGLALATFMFYQTIMSATVAELTTTNNGFDTKTIKAITNLRAKGEASKPLQKPAGRTNPFQ